ncbi:uncharacterized protein LOC136032339 [Artemia franciscana]|uniref:uncharacterized protein LOC136032339 n=1 Tax=Artemia franciscana TaxID=6661 RepID=UPI0032DB687C
MLRSACVFLPLLFLALIEGYFPAKERFLLLNLFNHNKKIIVEPTIATITKTVNPTCLQLLSSSLPLCQRKKRQIFLKDNAKANNFLYRADFVEHHPLSHQFAAQYIRPMEFFDNLLYYTPNAVKVHKDYKETDLIQSSFKAPATAVGRFFQTKPRVIVTTDIATVTVTQMAGQRVKYILTCFPATGVSEPFCDPSVFPQPASSRTETSAPNPETTPLPTTTAANLETTPPPTTTAANPETTARFVANLRANGQGEADTAKKTKQNWNPEVFLCAIKPNAVVNNMPCSEILVS